MEKTRKFIIAELSIRKLGCLVIISTDEDPSLRIDSSAIINLRGVSTKLYILNRIFLSCLHLDIFLLTLLVIHNRSLGRYQFFNFFPLRGSIHTQLATRNVNLTFVGVWVIFFDVLPVAK